MSLLRKDFRASLFHLEVRAPSLSLSLSLDGKDEEEEALFFFFVCASFFRSAFYAGAFVCGELFCVDELEKKIVFRSLSSVFSLSRAFFWLTCDVFRFTQNFCRRALTKNTSLHTPEGLKSANALSTAQVQI